MSQVPNVAVLLAGCGHVDGAEIREAVFTLLALDQHGARVQCFAPDAPQAEVVDHRGGQRTGAARNILEEASRIARAGKCLDLAKADPASFDALLLPGGAGVAKNFCTFAREGAAGTVRPDVLKFVSAFFEAGKPVGAICIAPALVAMVLSSLGRKGTLTLGSGEGVAGAMAQLGIAHRAVPSAREIVVDEALNLVTTPAYMYDDARISDVWAGIERCCAEVVGRIRPGR
ncbi:isoprenoid biosynthesis glyoxalase ElbB [Mesoterricola silvestris]|uniref:Isoprenoid biosynthesis protein ElbB n=1 Tax=Mesoterricola silvestris TaxID=2927979 RepID=A0AA48KBL5_9BACT|nr:isoprenoid biosynthesis glyoxalase ElbB [Mesoterricola silvestris]BDU72638.1 isoprenoid biosynthesis protein ElbB [Mesoterricola silvestris]